MRKFEYTDSVHHDISSHQRIVPTETPRRLSGPRYQCIALETTDQLSIGAGLINANPVAKAAALEVRPPFSTASREQLFAVLAVAFIHATPPGVGFRL